MFLRNSLLTFHMDLASKFAGRKYEVVRTGDKKVETFEAGFRSGNVHSFTVDTASKLPLHIEAILTTADEASNNTTFAVHVENYWTFIDSHCH